MNKLIMFVLITALSNLALAADYNFRAPKGWQKLDVPGVIEAWKSPKGEIIIISAEDNSGDRTLASVKSVEEATTAIELSRKSLLETFGISNWTVSAKDQSLKPSGPGHLLKFSGTYLGPSGRKMLFREWQHTTAQKVYQVQYTVEANAGPKTIAIDKLMNLFQLKGGA